MQKQEVNVVCYNCKKLIPKSEAFYIQQWDVYYCEQHYLDLFNNKPIRKPRGLKKT